MAMGLAGGISVSVSTSGAGIFTGRTVASGAMMEGGLLGKFSISGVKDSSGNYTGTVSAGPGIGAWAGELPTCSKYLRCLSEILG